MVNEETINEIDIDARSQKPEIYRLAIASMVFGMLGPFCAGAMLILSFNDFFIIHDSLIVVLFSCGVSWILGLLLGGKSLEQISNSEGQLAGTLAYLEALQPASLHACHCTDLASKIALAGVARIKEVGVGLSLRYDG